MKPIRENKKEVIDNHLERLEDIEKKTLNLLSTIEKKLREDIKKAREETEKLINETSFSGAL